VTTRRDAVGGYAFGDSAPAARRLGLLADLFAPASHPFLAHFAGRQLGLAVDLGCGTGHTTRLLASALAPRPRPRPVGVVRRPGRRGRAAGDVLRRPRRDPGPVPVPPGDLLSCRLLLSHLPDPPATLATWATQLAPGGLLQVDEVERIDTADPALRGYLDIAATLLASRGQTLEIGPTLHHLPDPPGLTRRHDRLATLSPPPARAAAMFAQNLAIWGPPGDRGRVVGEPEVDELVQDLELVAGGGRPAAITWELRQLAWEA